jgi:UDP-N-acetylmuramoyl-L-alanyl-D-glutamate--2,6-diaminopimelate ligase
MNVPVIFPVTCHTDYVGQGSTFVAIKGFVTDGVSYIATAIKKGAAKIVIADSVTLDAELSQLIHIHGCTIEKVPDTRLALAQLSAKAAGYPAKKLKIIGITGTKGKTTTSHLVFHMLQSAGISLALISSVTNAINGQHFKSSLIPPQPDYLHQFLKLCVEQNVEWVVMEVAAHAVSMHRIHDINFQAVVITNIAREHLEFYATMEEYAATKIKLLSYRHKNAPAWLNKDDTRLANVSDKDVHYFSVNQKAEIYGILPSAAARELAFTVIIKNEKLVISCPCLMGEYNAANIIAAIGAVQTVPLSASQIATGIKTFPGVKGRLETYQLPNGAMAIIDYAHNPLSYKALFSMLRLKTEHLVVLFGAGGDRDRGRRPEMGAIVAQYADQIVLTTDNPRFENPQQIINDILAGIPADARKKVIIEPDRERAICSAYQYSKQFSIIALVGKGPDEYQLIGNQKLPFSERSILKSLR